MIFQQEGYDMGYGNGGPPYYNTYGGGGPYHPPPPPLPHLMGGGADPRYATGNPYLGGGGGQQPMPAPDSPSLGPRQPPRNHRTSYATLGNRPYSPNANGTRSGDFQFRVITKQLNRSKKNKFQPNRYHHVKGHALKCLEPKK